MQAYEEMRRWATLGMVLLIIGLIFLLREYRRGLVVPDGGVKPAAGEKCEGDSDSVAGAAVTAGGARFSLAMIGGAGIVRRSHGI